MFSPTSWAESWKQADTTYTQHAHLSSGHAARIVRECESVFLNLLSELLTELQKVELLPADFFDRPQLAKVLSAVHSIKKEEGK